MAPMLVVGCGEPEPPTLPEPAGGEYGPPLVLRSDAFDDGKGIPRKYTCEGDNVSPPLQWDDVPEGTVSFALVVDDPDARRKVWVHWVAWAIASEVRELHEHIAADDPALGQATNDSGDVGWSGPCPPKIDGDHHYEFHLFAVDVVPELPDTTTRDELYRELDGHALALGELTGLFDR